MKWWQTLKYKLILSSLLIVSLISYFSYRSFSSRLTDNMNHFMEENYANIMQMLSNQSLYTLTHYGGEILPPILKNLEQSPSIEQIVLFASDGTVKYPTNLSEPVDFSPQLSDSLKLVRAKYQGKNVIQASLRIDNKRDCYRCHNPEQKVLGYLLIQFSAHEIDENLALNKQHNIIYTLLTMMALLLLIWGIHYFYIHSPLQKLIAYAGKVQLGENTLKCRLKSPQEFAILADHFHAMLDRLNEQQQEIERLHQIELQQSKKLAEIGKMAAAFAHEIKNPLMGIINTIKIITRNQGKGVDSDIYVELEEQGNRINRAINELLMYTRVTKYNPVKSNLNELIENVIKNLRNSIKKAEFIHILFRPDANIRDSYFDYNQMEIAVTNLILNAIQAVDVGGIVEVSTELDKNTDRLLIRIKDDGCGISDEIIEKIFDPFFTTRQQGTGLGLALARNAVNMHKGSISVKNLQKGCMFTISIPYIEEEKRQKTYA